MVLWMCDLSVVVLVEVTVLMAFIVVTVGNDCGGGVGDRDGGGIGSDGSGGDGASDGASDGGDNGGVWWWW